MAYIFISWVLLGYLSFLTGNALSWLLSRTTKINLITSFPLLVFLGFAFLSAISSWISLWAPINGITFGAIAFVVGIWSLYKRKGVKTLLRSYSKNVMDMHRVLPLLFFFALITALIYCAVPSKCYDEGLYYTQTIKWFVTYPVVHGLGNLESRLAMNSSWHLLSALFSFSSSKDGNLDDINGLLFVIAIMYSIGGINKLTKREFTLSNLLLATLILPNFLFYFSIMGPAADLVVTYYSWIIFVLLLEKCEEKTLEVFDDKFFLILVFSIFLFTVKLSAITILPILAYLVIIQLRKMQWKPLFVTFLFALFTITPWISRNIILSGYPLFPIPIFETQADWAMSKDVVKGVTCAAEGWAKMPMKSCEEVGKMHLKEWIPSWFSSKRIYDKAIFGLLIVSFVLSIFFIIRNVMVNGKKFIFVFQGYLVLFLTLLIGIMVWFFKAPDFRFGYGPILCLIICTIGVIFHPLLKKLSQKQITGIFAFGSFVSFVGMLFMLSVLEKNPKIFSSYLITPASLPVEPVHMETLNNLNFYLGKDQCWDAPLPSSPYPPSPKLHLRADKLEDGFSVK